MLHPMGDSDLRVEAVLAAFDSTSFVTARQPALQLEMGGIPGDRHFGLTRVTGGRDRAQYPPGTTLRNDRQITIVSTRECEAIASALGVPEVLPEWLGANVQIDGAVGFTSLPPGSRLVFPSGAVLRVEGENEPCVKPGRVLSQANPGTDGLPAAFVIASKGRRGIIASVVRGGAINPGDSVRVAPSLQRAASELG
jgi:MOSC domain-containing protein YiiM